MIRYFCFDRRRQSKLPGNADSSNESMQMQNLRKHDIVVENQGSDFENTIPVSIDDNLSYANPDTSYEELDERHHTYMPLGEHNKDNNYEQIIKSPNSDYDKSKSVSML